MRKRLGSSSFYGFLVVWNQVPFPLFPCWNLEILLSKDSWIFNMVLIRCSSVFETFEDGLSSWSIREFSGKPLFAVLDEKIPRETWTDDNQFFTDKVSTRVYSTGGTCFVWHNWQNCRMWKNSSAKMYFSSLLVSWFSNWSSTPFSCESEEFELSV